MHLTIVVPDQLVVIDGYPLEMELSNFSLPDQLHALQWLDDQGEEEYNDTSFNKSIQSLENYQLIINEHDRLKVIAETPPPPPTYQELIKEYTGKLDGFADSVRSRFLPGGTSIEAEYKHVAGQARIFSATDMTSQPPSGVADHMRRYSVDAETAVAQILGMESQFMNILDSIRSLRLDGKTALESLPDSSDESAFEAEYQIWHDQMDQFKDQA